MGNKETKKNTYKEEKKSALETLDELFGHGDVDDETLRGARGLMRSFMYKVSSRMKEKGLSTAQVAEDNDIPETMMENLLECEVFPDWITFYKLKDYLDIPVMFYDF